MSTADELQHQAGDRLVDANALRALAELRTVGEPDPVEEVVNLFLEATPVRLIELLRAAAQHDSRLVRDIAHTMKGSAGMVGAHAMQLAAAELEERSGGEALACVQRLTEIFARTKPVLLAFVHGGL